MMDRLKIMAVDDEPLALRRLEIILSRMNDVVLIGTARSGNDALARIPALAPDLLLLDIKMAGLDGFAIVDALAGTYGPQIIFVTAFDAFASRAFDVSAVDYILKPVGFDRLHMAIDKARRRIAQMDALDREAELRALVGALRASRDAMEATPRYESEFWVQHRGDFVRLLTQDIEWIGAERDYVLLHSRDKPYLLRETMTGMVSRLDPDEFVRIHRSAIVRKDRIGGIRSAGYGHYEIALQSSACLRVGRTYVKFVRNLIGGHGRTMRTDAIAEERPTV